MSRANAAARRFEQYEREAGVEEGTWTFTSALTWRAAILSATQVNVERINAKLRAAVQRIEEERA